MITSIDYDTNRDYILNILEGLFKDNREDVLFHIDKLRDKLEEEGIENNLYEIDKVEYNDFNGILIGWLFLNTHNLCLSYNKNDDKINIGIKEPYNIQGSGKLKAFDSMGLSVSGVF